MKPRVPITSYELNCIDAIVNRALIHFPDRAANDVRMDLMATHLINPLRLQALLDADDFNFIHDIVGIERHLDRQKHQMMDCFSPRFSAR